MAPTLRNPNRKFEDLKVAAARARLPFDKDVWLNLAFYLNEQYVEWASDAMTLRVIPRQEGFENTPRPVANKIMHFVASEHAMALQTRPTVDVMPATDNVLDSSDAAVSLAYLRWLFDPQVADFDGELSDATLWALIGGEGYLKWCYDSEKDQGDIVSVSPLDIYTDPYCKKFRHARYVIHSQFMDTEQVYDRWGVEVQATDLEKADPMKSALLRDMGNAPVLEGAVVNELWMKPCRRYPEGLFTVWAGKHTLIQPNKFPYEHKHLPFTQIGAIPRPGTPHYTCAVKYLRSPQMELNKFHAQRIMIRQTFANPKWFIDTMLELEHDPDDSPNQILRGNSNAGTIKPEIIQPTIFPAGDEGAWIVEEMMHTVGLHEVSQAQVPGRVEAAKAIELLKESDAGRLAELLRTTKSAIAEGGWQQLQLAKQFVSNDKILQTYSRDGMPEIKHFKKEAINPGLRVQITMGTGLARSRAAREDQVMKMVEMGVIQDPETVAELMDIPVGTVVPNKAPDIRLARNENITMATGPDGTAIKPNSWDDHAIHLREHNNYRKSPDYISLSDEAKQKFEFHCDTHESLEIEQLQKMAMKAQLMAAASGMGGTQSGPSEQPEQSQQQQAPTQQAA